MKTLKTVLLAGSFALASSLALAQGSPPVSGSAGSGADVGASPRTLSGSTGASGRAQAGGTKAIVDGNASGTAATKKKQSQTTGSGGYGPITGHGSPD